MNIQSRYVFAGFKPHDEGWMAWTAPLQSTIHAFLADIEEKKNTTPYAIVVLSECLKLSLDWPVEPIMHLAHRLERLGRLIAFYSSPKTRLILPVFDYCIEPTWDSTGESLSLELADILTSASTTQNRLLSVGEIIHTEYENKECVIDSFLQSDAYGETYLATMEGKVVLLKWYFPENCTEEDRQVLTAMIEKGPPSSHHAWPIDIGTSPEINGFGYLTKYRESDTNNLAELINGQIEIGLSAAITIGLNLVRRFMELHENGFCCTTIGLSKICFHSESSEVYIDNIGHVANEGLHSESVFKEHEIVAPEIIQGADVPNQHSDLYLLAEILFQVFFRRRPF